MKDIETKIDDVKAQSIKDSEDDYENDKFD